MMATSWACALALAVAAAPEADARADAEAAAERILANEPEEAVALLESVLARGFDGADVYYDLGIALEDAGRPVDAVLAYERALLRSPGDADAAHNLARLRAELLPDAPAPSERALGLADAFGPWLAPLPVAAIGWGAALALLVGCGLPSLRRPPLRGFRAVAFSAAAVGLAVVGLAAAVERSGDRAVVTASTPLRAAPDPNAEVSGTLRPGETVIRRGPARGPFDAVQRADGTVGHAERDALAPVRPARRVRPRS